MTIAEAVAFVKSIAPTIAYAKGLYSLNKSTEINQHIAPLLEKIISMEEHANGMLALIRELEEKNEAYRKKLMEFESWNETEQTHETAEVIPDIRVKVRKGLDDKAKQTADWYCTNCWNDRVKSILHLESKSETGVSYFCPKCKNKFRHAIHISSPNPFEEWNT
jgi:hypothetical protein